MDEYVSREAAIAKIREEGVYGSGYSNEEREDNVVDMITSIPASDVVSRDVFNRLLVENDTMRAQLALIGKKLGDSMDDVRLAVYTVKESLNNYGVDVTKLWQTATDQKAALDAAYVRGKNAAYKQTAAKDDPYKPLWPNWED